jgi:hypothetical protein
MDIRKGVVVSRTNLIDSKKEAGLPWKALSLVIFITFVLWAGAFFYHDYVQKKTTVLQQQLNSYKSSRDYTKIAAVADSQGRLSSIDSALAERVDWNTFFKKLEENTLPEVTFTALEAKNPQDNNGTALASGIETKNPEYLITLKGTTIGLSNLSKQIAVFEGNNNEKVEPILKNIKISKIDIKKTESGQVDTGHTLDFFLEATINPLISDNNSNNNRTLNNQ